MKITRRQLQELVMKELNVPLDSLAPEVIDQVVAAVKARTEKEGGAMGPDGVEDHAAISLLARLPMLYLDFSFAAHALHAQLSAGHHDRPAH